MKLKISNKNIKYSINFRKLTDQLEYSKVFILNGSLDDDILLPDDNGEILLDIAINPESNILDLPVIHELNSEYQEKLEVDFIGSNKTTQFSALNRNSRNSIVQIDVDKNVHSSSRYLINNAGSDFRPNGIPYDIGFGQEDNGQYNTERYVNALCGCCVLLRRELFIKRKIFISEFFAYFEDTELSNWINKNNFKILYTNALVYHKHSSTTQEKSPTWKSLVSRSKNLYEYIKDYSEANNGEQRKSYPTSINYEGIKADLKSKLTELDHSINSKSVQDLVFDDKIAVGIYNSFWSSMGGGEKHALDFAAKFKQNKNVRVYLISEKDFSISNLAKYFGLDLAGCKKIITRNITVSLTKRFDVFINSTYGSGLLSESPKSFYIVSFPHDDVKQNFLASYTFLHNSNFTASWSQKYWGEHQSAVIMPIQQFSANKKEEMALSKEKICLSVGRFNYMGHCKNQHLIIQAFNQATRELNRENNWKLIVVGSVDDTAYSSVEHFKDCQQMAGDNVEVIANIDRNELHKLYQKASIYIHGTGMNTDVDQNPHLCEHFGITVFEAIFNGCFPIVHNSAGPKDQVKNLTHSALFDSNEDLANTIYSMINKLDKNATETNKICTQIRNYSYRLIKKNNAIADRIIAESIKNDQNLLL